MQPIERPIVPRAMLADRYFLDKSLRPGEGHGLLAHQHDVWTLVLHGSLDEAFDHERHYCDRWELHFKPAGARHATGTGAAGVRMLLLGARPSKQRGEVPGAPILIGKGLAVAKAMHAFFDHAADPSRPVERRTIEMLTTLVTLPSVGEAAIRPSWVTELHECLQTEESQRTSLSVFARRFRCHPGSLARGFRRCYGTSISAFRRRLRVERAIDRLVERREAIADVAGELGYADQSHFTRELKADTGWSPGQLRAAASRWGAPTQG